MQTVIIHFTCKFNYCMFFCVCYYYDCVFCYLLLFIYINLLFSVHLVTIANAYQVLPGNIAKTIWMNAHRIHAQTVAYVSIW